MFQTLENQTQPSPKDLYHQYAPKRPLRTRKITKDWKDNLCKEAEARQKWSHEVITISFLLPQCFIM